jgi:hypothetical protein
MATDGGRKKLKSFNKISKCVGVAFSSLIEK